MKSSFAVSLLSTLILSTVMAAFAHADSLEPLVRQVLSTLGC